MVDCLSVANCSYVIAGYRSDKTHSERSQHDVHLLIGDLGTIRPFEKMEVPSDVCRVVHRNFKARGVRSRRFCHDAVAATVGFELGSDQQRSSCGR